VTHYLLRHQLERAAYRLPFHVRVPSVANADVLERQRNWSLERMRNQLERQGWTFVALSPERPKGPLPVVPVKGVGKRPVRRLKRRPGVPSGPQEPDDSLWRVSTLPGASELRLTDEVEWEYVAVFQRPIIPTAQEVVA
jgi:hypothetical protein